MAHLSLYLFGPPRFEVGDAPLKLERRKMVALLAYLAVTGQPQSRDTLATLLWPDINQSQARAALRRDLSILKKALGEGWLLLEQETVALTADPNLWVDVTAFRRELAVSREHDHPHSAVCPDCLPHLRAAISLYQADFLAGFTLRDSLAFDEWQSFQTDELRRELAEALERLVRGQSDQENFKTALPFARRWVALDPLHEPAQRELMALYARAPGSAPPPCINSPPVSRCCRPNWALPPAPKPRPWPNASGKT